MSRQKMTPEVVPQDFTLGLAAVDALPVLLFCCSAVLVGKLLGSTLFTLGASICFVSGALKVAWKVIVVLRRKNVWPLFLQMRIAMPAGFLLMLLALVFCRSRISGAAVLKGLTSFPSGLLFLAGTLLMGLMIVFAVKLDSSDVRANWAEQITNGIAQGCFFLGLLLL